MASSESTTRTRVPASRETAASRTSPGLGYDRRADLVNDAPDLSGTIKQVAKAGDDVVIMPRVAVQDRRGVGDDVVKRKSHLAADRLHRGARGALLLSLEQFQRVQRRGNVAAVDLQKLAVPIVEVVRLGTLDVERADDRAMIDEWHGQGAARSQRPRCRAGPWSCRGRGSSDRSRRQTPSRRAPPCAISSRVAARGDMPSLSKGINLSVAFSRSRISM